MKGNGCAKTYKVGLKDLIGLKHLSAPHLLFQIRFYKRSKKIYSTSVRRKKSFIDILQPGSQY